MKNIPVFTTEHGVASLILDQISFNGAAYIRIQSSAEQNAFVKECLDFCKAVGADSVYMTGIAVPQDHMGAFSLIIMERKRSGLAAVSLDVIPVCKSNMDYFKSVYNEKMRNIPLASAMSSKDLDAVIQQKNGYLLYENGDLLGIGIADDGWIRSIIAVKRGAGERILLALNQLLHGDTVRVELVDANIRAKRLYDRLGFRVSETIETWYKIF